MTPEIRVDLTGGVLTITLARPDKKNALTNEMYGTLADTIEEAEHASHVRVVLVQGDGDMFTAGNDVGEFAAIAAGKGPSERHVHRFLHALAKSTVPIVAAVNGKAVGVGTTMLLHCDLVYAARSATFTAPFVNLALVPEAASSLLLPQRIGHAKGAELFLLGAKLDAAGAEAAGLVSAVFDDAALLAEATTRAKALAAKAPNAVRLTKALMKRQPEAVAARMAQETRHFGAQLTSPEVREAITAFMQKRAPDFSSLS